MIVKIIERRKQMKEKESERPDECLDWKKEVLCAKGTHESNIDLPPCGKTWETEENDLLLYNCNKFNSRYVAIKCPSCDKITEVSAFAILPVPIQYRLKGKKVMKDSCCGNLSVRD
jgi:hypothetical protein